jgi:hypothetical protein
VAAAGRKGRKTPTEEATDHFKKMLEAPCPNQHYLVQHACKDCGMLRKFLSKEALPPEGLRTQKRQREGKKGPRFFGETKCLLSNFPTSKYLM